MGKFDVSMGPFPHSLFPGCRHLELQYTSDWLISFAMRIFTVYFELFSVNKNRIYRPIARSYGFKIGITLCVSVCHHLSKGFKPIPATFALPHSFQISQTFLFLNELLKNSQLHEHPTRMTYSRIKNGYLSMSCNQLVESK